MSQARSRVLSSDRPARASTRTTSTLRTQSVALERADAILADSDIFIIPDVLCNAGGVTVSYFEWVQDMAQFFWSEEQVNEKLRELMLKAFRRVRDLACTQKLSMRTAALSLGVQKIAQEKMRRGLYP